MATYKYPEYLSKLDHAAFDAIHGPGAETPFSGIYRCMGCNREIAANQKQPFPPQNHHQHSQQQGNVRWRLIAYADHEPKG